jgi:pimeloyl-ACP methyl ester carboxylesterase
VNSNSFLLTQRQGPADAMPWLVLHDRWGMLEDATKLAEVLGPDALTVAIRAPRVQNQGGTGQTKGYFWTVGPVDAPELSTLGDGLYQLEIVLEENLAFYAKDRLGVLGKGQGGVVALLLAAIFPDKVKRVIVIDATLPTNLKVMPFEPSLKDVEVVLVGDQSEEEVARLEALGAIVSRADLEALPTLAS